MSEKNVIIDVTIDTNLAISNIKALENTLINQKSKLNELASAGKKNTDEYIKLNAQYQANSQILKGNQKILNDLTKSQTISANSSISLQDKIKAQNIASKEQAIALKEAERAIIANAKAEDLLRIANEKADIKKRIQEEKELARQLKETEKATKDAEKASIAEAKALQKLDSDSKNLRKQLREIKVDMAQLALAGKDGSAEFLQMAQKAGKLKDALDAVNDQTKTFAVGSKFELGLKTAKEGFEGVAGGAQIAEGAMALFGSENENVTKSIQRMMAIQSMVNGVQAIFNALKKEGAVVTALMSAKTVVATGIQATYTAVVGASTGALKAFKVALAGTGILALVALLGTAIAGLANLKSSADSASESLEDMSKSNENFIKSLEDKYNTQNSLTQKNIDLLKEQGGTIQEVYNAENNLLLDKKYQLRLLFNETKYGYSEELKALKAKEGVTQVEIDDLIKKRNLALESINNSGKQLNVDIEILRIQKEKALTEQSNANKLAQREANILKQKENTQGYLKAELALINEIERQEIKSAKTQGEKDKAIQTAIDARFEATKKLTDYEYEQSRISITNANTLRDEELRNYELLNKSKLDSIEKSTIEQIQLEKNRLIAIQNVRIAENSKDLADELSQKELTKDQIDAINLKYSNNEIALKQETAEVIKGIDKAVADNAIALNQMKMDATLSTTSNMLGAVASLFEENSNEYKAFATAQALVDTYSSANSAYKSVVGTPVVGPVLAPIAAGTAVLAGLANVRKINQVKKGSTSVGGGGGSSKPNYSMKTNTGLAQQNIKTPTTTKQTTQVAVVVDDVTVKQATQTSIQKASTI